MFIRFKKQVYSTKHSSNDLLYEGERVDLYNEINCLDHGYLIKNFQIMTLMLYLCAQTVFYEVPEYGRQVLFSKLTVTLCKGLSYGDLLSYMD